MCECVSVCVCVSLDLLQGGGVLIACPFPNILPCVAFTEDNNCTGGSLYYVFAAARTVFLSNKSACTSVHLCVCVMCVCVCASVPVLVCYRCVYAYVCLCMYYCSVMCPPIS